ncbi:hypothetical protein ZHAS_00021484 [Anopheles sinensis]|uniref:Uncharacterized protein n=1 Tax=Anopheles sinensis TaxID=74873 RepID=A0A084WSI6_ANOSI|nr:hypothetical protein ZHAS_00021484 [Anopheles sinensis]
MRSFTVVAVLALSFCYVYAADEAPAKEAEAEGGKTYKRLIPADVLRGIGNRFVTFRYLRCSGHIVAYVGPSTENGLHLMHWALVRASVGTFRCCHRCSSTKAISWPITEGLTSCATLEE